MLRDNTQRARQTLVLFWVIFILNAVSILCNVIFVSLPSSYDINNPTGPVQVVIILNGLLAAVYAATVLLATVFFLQWFRRAYLNLLLAGRWPQYQDGWAVGAWFVPFMNLVRPYSIMKEIWHEINELAGRDKPHNLVTWWWVAYLVHSVLSNISNKYAMKAETMMALQDSAVLEMISSVANMASAYSTILVVRHIHQAEQEMQLFRQVEQLGKAVPELEADDLRPTGEESYA